LGPLPYSFHHLLLSCLLAEFPLVFKERTPPQAPLSEKALSPPIFHAEVLFFLGENRRRATPLFNSQTLFFHKCEVSPCTSSPFHLPDLSFSGFFPFFFSAPSPKDRVNTLRELNLHLPPSVEECWLPQRQTSLFAGLLPPKKSLSLPFSPTPP